MKQLFTWALLFATVIAFGQENNKEEPKEAIHELRLNMTNLILLKGLNVSYEYFINEESTTGVSVYKSLNEDLDFYKTFSVTPYFRHFFSINSDQKKFFAEVFGMIHNGEQYLYSTEDNPNKTHFAMGISAGHKYVSDSGFVVETFFGYGRNLTSQDDDDFPLVGRGGISFGYQF